MESTLEWGVGGESGYTEVSEEKGRGWKVKAARIKTIWYNVLNREGLWIFQDL